MAVVGPLTSLAVGLGGAAAAGSCRHDGLLLLASRAWPARTCSSAPSTSCPGLPLDGGRVLKAAVWGPPGSAPGRIVAGWSGRGWPRRLVLLWPVGPERWWVCSRPSSTTCSPSSSACSCGRVPRRRCAPPRWPAVCRWWWLERLARRTLAVPADLPLAEAVRRAQEAQTGAIVTVTSAGLPAGVVNEAALAATPAERRPWVATSTVARTVDDGLRLPASISGRGPHPTPSAPCRRPSTCWWRTTGSVCGVLAVVRRRPGGPGALTGR